MDGALRSDDRRGKEVRRVAQHGPGRLERGTRARGSGEGRSAAQAGVGQGAARGRREAPAGVGRAGIDRRVRILGTAKASGPRADVVRGAIEACRLEAREPAGVRLGGGGHAVRAEKIAVGPRRPVTWALAGVSGRTATGWRTNRRWQPAMLRRPWAVATSRIAHLDRRGGGEGAAQAARCAPGSRRGARRWVTWALTAGVSGRTATGWRTNRRWAIVALWPRAMESSPALPSAWPEWATPCTPRRWRDWAPFCSRGSLFTSGRRFPRGCRGETCSRAPSARCCWF